MAIIVYAIDDQQHTIEFFKNDVDAIAHKNRLEQDWPSDEVVYTDIPNLTVAHAQALYEVIQ